MKNTVIVLGAIFLTVIFSVAVIAPNFRLDYDLGRAVRAASSGSMISGASIGVSAATQLFFGGKITKFSICQLDSPTSPTCNATCKECMPIISKTAPAPGACALYNQLIYEKEESGKAANPLQAAGKPETKKTKTEILCPLKTFAFLGGLPRPNKSFLGFGLTRALPFLIYVTGL